MSSLRRNLILFLSLLGAVFAAQPFAFGATYTWDGGATPTRTWSNAANWNPDGAPVSGIDTAIIFAGITNLFPQQDSASFVLNSLAFDNTAGNFSLSSSVATNVVDFQTSSTSVLPRVVVGASGVSSTNIVNSMRWVLTNDLTVDATRDLRTSAPMSGPGSLTKEGPGTLFLAQGASANSSYTGGTFINGGVVSISKDSSLGDTSGGITFNGGTLEWNLTLTSGFDLSATRSITLLAGGGTLRNAIGSSTPTPSTISQAISGPGTLTIDGGWVTLANAANTQGGTVLNNAILTINAETALGPASSPLTINNGQLNWGAQFNLDPARPITINGTTLNTNGFDTTLSHAINGGSLTKDGAGTLVLTNPANNQSSTTVLAGTLQVSSESALGPAASPLDMYGNTTLKYDTGMTSFSSARNINFVTGPGGNVTLDTGTSTVTLNGDIFGPAGVGLRKDGAGTLILPHEFNYPAPTVVAAGTLKQTVANALPLTNLSVQPGATFDLNNLNAQIQTLSGGGTVNLGSGTLTIGGLGWDPLRGIDTSPGSNNFSGSINGSGNLALSQSFLNLQSQLNYGGTTTLTWSTLILGTTNALPTSTDLIMTHGSGVNQSEIRLLSPTTIGSLDTPTVGFPQQITWFNPVTLTVGNSLDTTFNGLLYGNPNRPIYFTKQGSGTLTFSGTQFSLDLFSTTNPGEVNVNGGTLKLVGLSTIYRTWTYFPTFRVNSGGTLTGDGNIKVLEINSGGTLSPGNSPGTFFSNNVSWLSGGHYNWQIHDAAGTQGVDWDRLDIIGSLTVEAGAELDLWSLSQIGPDQNGDATNFNPLLPYSWVIATTTAGVNGPVDLVNIMVGPANGTGGFDNLIGNGFFTLSVSGNNLMLNFNPADPSTVPEPSSLLLTGLAAAAYLYHRRRRTAGCRTDSAVPV